MALRRVWVFDGRRSQPAHSHDQREALAQRPSAVTPPPAAAAEAAAASSAQPGDWRLSRVTAGVGSCRSAAVRRCLRVPASTDPGRPDSTRLDPSHAGTTTTER